MMSNLLIDLENLKTVDGYSTHFMDAEIWTPVIQRLCRERGIMITDIWAGTAGTFPTFILDRKFVIKFFGPLFGGADSYKIETSVNSLLAQFPGIPAARILECGPISPNVNNWQFILFNYLPGQSYREDLAKITDPDRQAVAFRIGEILHILHSLPVPESLASLFPPDPALYRARHNNWFLARLRCAQPQSPAGLGLPARLAGQAADFLYKSREDADIRSPLHLIHADMTQEHILGDFSHGHWQINGLIDFGDCMTGDLFYELAPLHLDFFDCNKRLLVKFLEGYQARDFPISGFARQCLCAALQHQFNVFSGVFERHPELAEIGNLDQLAQTLWELD